MALLKEVDLYEYTEQREAESENFLQMQTAYIAYMMISSYFLTCKCQNKVKEENLFLHYSDMRQREQMAIESQLEREFQRSFYDCLDTLANLHCEVIFSMKGEDMVVYFHTGLEELTCTITPTGEYTFERLWE